MNLWPPLAAMLMLFVLVRRNVRLTERNIERAAELARYGQRAIYACADLGGAPALERVIEFFAVGYQDLARVVLAGDLPLTVEFTISRAADPGNQPPARLVLVFRCLEI